MTDAFSPELKRFIAENFESIEHMKILFLLRMIPEREWSLLDVCREIRIDPLFIAEHLQKLHLSRFIDHEIGAGRVSQYSYRRQGVAGEQLLNAAALLFRDHQSAVAEWLEPYARSESAFGR
jgi:hypothetical protein